MMILSKILAGIGILGFLIIVGILLFSPSYDEDLPLILILLDMTCLLAAMAINQVFGKYPLSIKELHVP